MMQTSQRVIRKFNPGTFQSDREVMDQFVVRHRELAATLEVLRDNIDAESCQHLLLVSPRGRGKTMLLARVAAELRTDPAYRNKLFPVRFMEESHEVFDIGDFWMDALFYLAKECATTEPELARELEGAHASLAKEWRDPRLDYRARAMVLNAADQLDRQLVLMVENLQALSEDVDEDFGWALRESLQMEPKVILLGTATSRFRALDDVREAFYELFRIMTLDPLDTDECRELWTAVTVTKNQIKQRDMRPLEVLTGGSPRLLVIVADFARHRSFRQLLEELVTLVDDHTEYFRGHLEALPKTERRVYLAALGLWRPSTTGEIAVRARMGVRTTSSMLGRLVDRGALTAEGPKRRKRYVATERLYCMYYKIRRERDEAAVVQALIRFMMLFYQNLRSASEIGRSLADEVARAPNILEGMIRALREDPRVGVLAPEAAFLAYDSMIGGHLDGRRAAGDGAREKSTDAIAGGIASDMMGKARLLFHEGQGPEAIRICDEIVERYSCVASVEARVISLRALSNKAAVLSSEGRVSDAVAIYRDIADQVRASGVPKLQWIRASTLVNMGASHMELEEWKAALDAWKQTVQEFGDCSDTRTARSVAGALYRIGCVQLLLKRAESALHVIKEVKDRYGTSPDGEIREIVAHSLTVQGDALERLNRYKEALAVHREQQERFGDIIDAAGVSIEWRAILGRTRILLLHGRDDIIEPGRKAIRELYAATNMESDENLKEMYAWIVVFGASSAVSPSELADVLSSDQQRSKAFWPLTVALRRMAGEDVRVPIEVMEVAEDLLEQMNVLKTGLSELSESGVMPASVGQSLLETVPKLAAGARGVAAGLPPSPE